MTKLLSFLLLNALLAQMSSGRHIPSPNYSYQKPKFTNYKSDEYSYTGPDYYSPQYPQPYHLPHTSSLYTPPGTYYDQRRGILRPFPGGGIPVLVDYHKRCSNQFVGLKAHPEEKQYYYVCKPDCVIFGKCQNLQIFNSTSGQCVQHPPPEYIPTCSKVGRFPLFSDCHLYYKCNEDLQAKIYTCPPYMIFSPTSQKCINGNKCTPTQISPHSSYMPEYCANKFPPCYETGIFRSPTDCSLYYSCERQNNGMYLQTRLRCPNGQFYDLQKNNCLPAQQVPCDCIQIAELVYPKPNSLAYHPKVYPAQFNLDSMEDNSYPIELSKEEFPLEALTIGGCNNSESESENQSVSESEAEEDNPTTANPVVINTTLAPQPLEETTPFEHIQFGDDVSVEEEEESSQELTTLSPKGIFTTETVDSTTQNWATTFTFDNEFKESLPLVLDASNEFQTETVPVEEVTTVATVATSESPTMEPEITTTIAEELSTFSDESTPHIHEETTINPAEATTPNITTTSTSTTVLPTPVQPSSATLTIPCVEMHDTHKEVDQAVPSDILTAQTHTNSCKPSALTLNQDTTNQATVTTLVSEFTRGSRSARVKQNMTATALTPTTLSTHVNTATTLEADQVKNVELSEALANNRNNLIPLGTRHTSGIIISETTEQTITEMLSNKSIITTDTSAATTISTSSPWDLEGSTVTESDFMDKEILLNDEELSSGTNKEIRENKTLLDDKDIMEPSFLSAEGFIPVHSRTIHMENPPKQTTDFDYVTVNPGDDFTTDINVDYDFDTVTAIPQFLVMNSVTDKNVDRQTSANPTKMGAKEEAKSNTVLKRRQTSEVDSISEPIQIKPADELPAFTESSIGKDNEIVQVTSTLPEFFEVQPTSELPNTSTVPVNSSVTKLTGVPELSKILENVTVPNTSELSEVFTVSDIFTVPETSRVPENTPGVQTSTVPPLEEVSKLENITAGPVPTFNPFSTDILNAKTSATTLTPTQTTTNPTNFLDLKVREVQSQDHDHDCNKRKLFYEFKTQPVITKTQTTTNINNNVNKTVAETACLENNSDNIPRLEIIAESPVDVHFRLCPSDCNKQHEHNYPASSNRAVFVKWFANKSNQTMGFETTNEVKTTDDKDY